MAQLKTGKTPVRIRNAAWFMCHILVAVWPGRIFHLSVMSKVIRSSAPCRSIFRTTYVSTKLKRRIGVLTRVPARKFRCPWRWPQNSVCIVTQGLSILFCGTVGIRTNQMVRAVERIVFRELAGTGLSISSSGRLNAFAINTVLWSRF